MNELSKLKQTRFYLSAALAGWLGIAAPAQAQTGQRTLSAEGQTFGAFTREIELRVAADATYESNVLGSRAETEVQRGLEKEDVILAPRVEADVALPLGPIQFSVNGQLGYDIYTRNSELSSERMDVNFTAQGGAPGCGATIAGGFARSQNELRNLSIVPGDLEASSINVQTVTRIGATIYCGQVVGFRPVALAEYRRSRNSNDLRRVSNVDSFTYGGGVMYSSPLIGELTAFASQTKFEYPDASPLQPLGFPDVDVLSGGVRLDRRLGARLQANGQLTYVKVDVAGASGAAFEGLNWDVSATLRASDRLQLTLSTARQVDASSGFRSNYVRTESYVGSVAFAFTQRLRFLLLAAHEKRNFDQTSVVLLPNTISEDQFTRVTGRLDFQRFRRLGFNLFAGYEKRNADLSVYDYASFNAGVGVRLLL